MIKNRVFRSVLWLLAGLVTGYLGLALAFFSVVAGLVILLDAGFSGPKEHTETYFVLALVGVLVGLGGLVPGSIAMGARGLVKLLPRSAPAGHPGLWVATAVAVPLVCFTVLRPVMAENSALIPLAIWVPAVLAVAAAARLIARLNARLSKRAELPPPPPPAPPRIPGNT